MSAAADDGLILMTWTARCRPDTKWIQLPPVAAIIAIGLGLMLLGGIIGAEVNEFMTLDEYVAPTELTEAQHKEKWINYKTIPNTIKLRIVSQDEFEKTRMASNVLAFARIARRPCEIVIPEGWRISFNPQDGYENSATWDNPTQGNTLAHEITHCFLGSWHKPIKLSNEK